MSILYINEVNHKNLTQWLSLSDIKDDSIHKKVAESIAQDQDLFRFIVCREEQIIARFSVELQAKSIGIWWPKINQEIDNNQWKSIFQHILKYVEIFGKEKEKTFIELKIRPNNLLQSSWVRYLLSKEFKHLSNKDEYEINPLQHKLTSYDYRWEREKVYLNSFGVYSSHDAEIESIYQKTIQGSLDRSDLYEYQMEVPLGQVDHLWLLSNRTDMIGLIACLSESKNNTVWIKYLGIVPIYRQQGYGSYLLGEALLWAESQQFTCLRSLIDQENLPSIATHKRAGFVEKRNVDMIACLYKTL